MSTNVLASMSVVLGSNIKGFERGLAVARKKLDGFVQAGERLQNVGQNLTIGVTLPTAAIAGFGLKLASEMEQAKVALTTMTGSAEQANKTLAELKQFAASTPFEFPEIQDAAKKLLAFGVSTDDVSKSLRSIGDISAGIGAPISEIAELFGKAKVQGRLFGEDINQLTGRGIPIIQELAKQFGVAESEVKKLVEKGSVNFSHLEQAFTDMTAEGSKFGGLMAAQSQTLGGLWSTLTDDVSMALADMGTDLAEAFDLKGIMQSVSSAIQNISAAFQGLSPEVKKIIFVVAGLAAAAGPLAMALGGFMTMLPALTAGMASLGAAFTAMTGPIGLAVAAVVVGIALIIKNWDKIKAYFTSGSGAAIFDKLKSTVSKAFNAIKAVISRFVDIAIGLWNTFGKSILNVAMVFWNNLKSVFENALTTLGFVLDMFRAAAEGNWSGLWQSFKNVAASVINGIIDLVSNFALALPRLLNGALKGLGINNSFTRGLDTALKNTKKLIEGIKLETKEVYAEAAKVPTPGAADATTGSISAPNMIAPTVDTSAVDKQRDILAQLRKEFNDTAKLASVFGESYDEMGNKAKLLEGAITSLIQNGMSPQNAVIKDLKSSLDALPTGLATIESSFTELGKSISAPFEHTKNVVLPATTAALLAFREEQRKASEIAAARAMEIGQTVGDMASAGFTALGEGLANMFNGMATGMDVLKNVGKALLQAVAEFCGQLGKKMIAIGIAENLLVPGSGIPKLIAGGALVALSAFGGAMAGSIGGGKGSAAPSVGGGASSPRPSATRTFERPQAQELRFRIDGRDLVAISEKQSAFTKRVGG